MQTDASKYAIGGQLYQLDDDQQIGVVAFTSRVLRGAELNYFTTELELLSIVHCLKKFRIYIMGNPITIITDNKALSFIQKCRLSNSRITRWILGMQEYDFDVIHCKGKDNIAADVLSRYPADMTEDTIEDADELVINHINIKINSYLKNDLRQIGALQLKEEKLKTIIDSIRSDDNNKYNGMYKWYNNKLYRKERGSWRILLTDRVTMALIKEIHEGYGHIGGTRTYQMFREYFAGSSVHKRIKQLIKGCEMCQKYKDNGRKGVGETRPVIPTKKGELVSLDYYGPLPTSTGGVKYLLVMVDNFSKYVKLYTLKRATTVTTINKLKAYINEVSKPEAVLTDNGTQFTSKRWVEALEEYGIKRKVTAIRNPCTNLAERINRQLGNMFRVFVGECHSKWAKYVRLVEECINQTYHETIQTTPYEAQWQQKPIRAWTKYVDLPMFNQNTTDPKRIYLRIKEKGQKRADRINRSNKLVSYDVGDMVLLKTNPSSDLSSKIIQKFCALYEGPYRIHRKVGNATYEIEDGNNTHVKRGIFNVRQLKPFVRNE